MWFGANMAGRRNKNSFKFVLQLLILSLGVANVVLGGLEVVWGVSADPTIQLYGCRTICRWRPKIWHVNSKAGFWKFKIPILCQMTYKYLPESHFT